MKKTRSRKDRRIQELENVLINNTKAERGGPKPKTWTTHDLKTVKPKTQSQSMVFEAFLQNQNIILNGSAGTGKSYISLYLALNAILSESFPQNKIKIIRSIVPSREIGHLPGSIEEKIAVYENPYRDIFKDLLRRNESYQDMKDANLVEFEPSSFVRGVTWDNTVVVVDECQNFTMQEIHSVMTRLGKNSILVVCGDFTQNDLIQKKNDTSGYRDALKIWASMKEVDIINFSEDDIVRSAFVKNWIIAKQNLSS